MYAMTKHIKKAMAAFLCACLLLSYNPAAGMVPTAEAAEQINQPTALESPVPSQGTLNESVGEVGGLDYGDDGDHSNGTASTTVNVVTYDGSLQTVATPSFSANTQQLSENGAKLIVMALSPQAENKNSYTFTWTVSRDGGDADDSLATGQMTSDSKILIPQSNGANDNCVSVIDLQNLFDYRNPNTTYFADGHTYTFTCVTECAGDKVTNTIELVTVKSEDYNWPEPADPSDPDKPTAPDPDNPDDPTATVYAKRLDAKDATDAAKGTAVVIYDPTGGFYKGSSLQAAEMMPVDVQNYYGAVFAEEAAALPADPTGYDYELGPILTSSIKGATTSDDDGDIPAYVGKLTMLLPLDEMANTTEEGKPRYEFELGQAIKVLYLNANDTKGDTKGYVEATVVQDLDGSLKAMFTIDEKYGPFMPGYFAVAYAPNDVITEPDPTDPTNPDKNKPAQPLKSAYTIDVNVTSSVEYGEVLSTVDLDHGIWSIHNPQSVTDTPASYTFVPAPSVVNANGDITNYSLDTVKLRAVGEAASAAQQIVSGNGRQSGKVSINGQIIRYAFENGVLTLEDCAPKGAYILDVAFTYDVIEKSELPKPNTPESAYAVHASLVDESGATKDLGNTSVLLSYYDGAENPASAVLSKKGADLDITAFTHTTTSFVVNDGGAANSEGTETYYLKEIRLGSGVSDLAPVSPIASTYSVKNDVNGDPIYIQFVIGKRTTTYEPPTSLEATFTVADGNGSILKENGTTGDSETRKFVKGQDGSQVTFIGNDGGPTGKGYYADHVVVKNADDQIVSPYLSLNNTGFNQEFVWTDWTMYPHNVTFEVYFDERPMVHEFPVSLGEGSQHGTIAPSGWTPGAAFIKGTELMVSVKPDDGYKLDGNTVTVTYRDGSTVTSEVVGGFATIKVDNEIVSVGAIFKEKDAADKVLPGGAVSVEYDLGVYVAYKGLSAIDYATKNLTTGTNAVVPNGSGSLDDKSISVENYSLDGGLVNGKSYFKTKVTATKADGYPTYPLSMAASDTYQVEKILVVTYNTSGSTKTVKSRTLYYTSWAAFDVPEIKGDTDVFVYFEYLDGEDPTYDPDTIDWVYVTNVYEKVKQNPVNTNTGETTYANESEIRIVKGQGFVNRIVPKDGFVWDGLERWEGDDPDNLDYIDMSDEISIGSRAAHMVNLTSVLVDTEIDAYFKTATSSSDPEGANYYSVSAPTTPEKGYVKAITDGDTGRVLGTWPEVASNTDMKLLVHPENGYELTGFSMSVSGMKTTGMDAFVNASAKTIGFATSAALLGSGDWTKVDGTYTVDMNTAFGKDVVTENVEWNLVGLQGNLYIEPVFTKAEAGENGEITVPDPKDYWLVNATITKGAGTIYCPQATNGYPMAVSKDPQRTVRMYFTPGETDEGLAYELTKVTVKKETDNIFVNFWETVTSIFGASEADKKAQEAVERGYLEFVVNGNYEITAEFDFADPTLKDDDKVDSRVVVNALTNAYKGTIAPPSARLSKTSGEDKVTTQQFVVSPFRASNGLYYSVSGVKVTYFDDSTGESVEKPIKAGTNDDCLTWDTTYANVFTLDVSKLDLSPTNTNTVTIEVEYSDSANVSGSFGPGGSSQTPTFDQMKPLTVSVANATGGLVNPAGGPFYIMSVKDGDTYTSQRVTVSPAPGYRLKDIQVTLGDRNATWLAEDYLKDALAHNSFDVSTSDRSAEVIVVTFEQEDMAQRTFALTANVYKDITADPAVDQSDIGVVVPHTYPVRLYIDKGETQTFTAAPKTKGWAVLSVEDAYEDADGVRHVIPAGTAGAVTWYRGENDMNPNNLKELHNVFVAAQVNVNAAGEIVTDGTGTAISSRTITVKFIDLYTEGVDEDGNKVTPDKPRSDPKYDFTGVDKKDPVTGELIKDPVTGEVIGGKDDTAEMVDILVYTWGEDKNKLTIDPSVSLRGVYRQQGLTYDYKFYLDEAAQAYVSGKGYLKIYCVEQNGQVIYGNKTTLHPQDDLRTEATVHFDYDKLTRKTNKLNVYVQYFSADELKAETLKFGNGTIIIEDGGKGEIVERTASGSYDTISRSAAASASMDDRASYLDGTGQDVVNPEDKDPNKTEDPDKTENPIENEDKDLEAGEEPDDSDQEASEATGQTSPGGSSVILGGTNTNMNNMPEDYYLVPPVDADGTTYVISQVYLYNCVISDFAWLKPQNVPDKNYSASEYYKVLNLILTRANADEDGYVYVKYAPMADADKAMWASNPEKKYGEDWIDAIAENNALNNQIIVGLTSNDGKAQGTLYGTVDEVLHVDKTKAPEFDWYDGQTDENGESVTFRTIAFDQETGDFTLGVGPLIDWDNKIIYTIDEEWIANNSKAGNKGMKLEVTPDWDEELIAANQEKNVSGDARLAASEDDDADAAEGPEYATNYIVKGNVKNLKGNASNGKIIIEIPLVAKTTNDGKFPEYPVVSGGNQGNDDNNNGDDNQGNQGQQGTMVTLTTSVNNTSYGRLVPIPVTTDGNTVQWYGSDQNATSFQIAAGTRVSFRVSPSDSKTYGLKSLTRTTNGNTINCINTRNTSEYDAALHIVTFNAEGPTTLNAVFDTIPNVSVDVTIAVVAGEGSSSPTPGVWPAQMGEDFTIYYDPATGYEVDYVRVRYDGAEPQLLSYTTGAKPSGMKLLAQRLWQPTTVEIAYRLAGSNPTYPPNDDSDNLLPFTGQTGMSTAGSTPLSPTGDTLWMVIALVIVAAGAVTTVVATRRRKAEAASRAARAAKYSVTPRKRR